MRQCGARTRPERRKILSPRRCKDPLKSDYQLVAYCGLEVAEGHLAVLQVTTSESHSSVGKMQVMIGRFS